jgi:hypothetical protein
MTVNVCGKKFMAIFIGFFPGYSETVFTTVHFLRNLQMGPIS